MSDKMLRRLGAWLRLAVGCALALSVAAPAASQQDAALLSVLRNLPDRIPFPVDVVQSKSAVAARSQRIDPLLLTLSDDVSSKGASSLTASAGALQMSVRENRVAVKLIAKDRNGREELEWRVEDEGGVVTATLDNVVLANLPVGRIEVFEDEADLYYMTAQAQFSHAPPDVGAVSRRGVEVEAGVRAIGAERLHAAGRDGARCEGGDSGFRFSGLRVAHAAGRVAAAGGAASVQSVRPFGERQRSRDGVRGNHTRSRARRGAVPGRGRGW